MSGTTKNNGDKMTDKKGMILTDGKDNDKLLLTGQKNRVYIACMSLTARDTCPGMGLCGGDCYAWTMSNQYKSVANKYASNYELSKLDSFVDMVNSDIANVYYGHKYIRIHVSGDFYSSDYLAKWVKIANDNPDKIFYAYTKSVPIVKEYKDKYGLPDNLIITYSYGGKFDDMIDPVNDRHVIVISKDAPAPAGYADGSKDDLAVVKYQKVYLRYHGRHKWENSQFRFIKLPDGIY